jgi:tetratricopeptide (TPR) repeat protein
MLGTREDTLPGRYEVSVLRDANWTERDNWEAMITTIAPDRIRSREDLTAQLAELFHRGGWSRHRLAEAAGLSTATVQAVLTGRSAIPRTRTLVAFVTACGQDPGPWVRARGRLARARQQVRLPGTEKDGTRPGTGTTSRAGARSAARGPLVGTPIRDLTDAHALHFEVHHAVTITGAPDTLPVLPTYLPRAQVDERLRREVAAAAQSSRMVVVVGDSSSGKSRACWEAVRTELTEWKIWHPLAPDRASALIDAVRNQRVAPRTVLWLNETQFYLDAGMFGEQVAAVLQDLLADLSRGPVLVLGSMWPEYWRKLTELPHSTVERHRREHQDENLDRHRAARTLLGQAIEISMPRGFTDQQLAALQATITSDPRLEQAAHSASGRITQYLAGAPELLRRYQHANPAARAVLYAAIDALRFGHRRYLPEPMLEEAAGGYIDQHDWDQLSDDWFDTAMAALTASHRRMPGPLVPYRRRPSDPPAEHRLYQLADFLEQHGRTERHDIPPPATLWGAARHTTPPDMLKLARAAFGAGDYQRAELLFSRAADSDDPEALGYLSWLMEHGGDHAAAERLARRQAELEGPASALRSLALRWEAQGRYAEAERLALDAIQAGDPYALRALVWQRKETGHHARARQLAASLATPAGAVLDRWGPSEVIVE